jgi:hypothetical protein
MKIRTIQRNRTVASRFLLGLLGTVPILLLSSTAQAGSSPSKQILTEAIQKVSVQSVDRAVLARQQITPPNSILALRTNTPHGQRCGIVCL